MLFDESQCSILSDEKTTTDDESLNKYKESNLKFRNLSANVASSFKTPVLKTNKLLRDSRLVKTQQVVRGKQLNRLTFIESLSVIVEHEHLRDPAVNEYMKKFRNNNAKNDLLRECFNQFNAAAFDNKLPKDMKLSWSKRLTATGGFCKNNLVHNTSEIQISSKVCDTPGKF